MHPSFSFALMAVLLAAPVATGTQALYVEQEVVIEAVADRPAMQGLQRTWMTDAAVRNEVSFGEEHPNVLLVDVEKERVILIPSKEKQYIQLPLADYLELVSMRLDGSGFDVAGSSPELEPTGKTRTIGDWTCAGYVLRQEGKVQLKLELWIAEDSELDFAAYLRLMKRVGLDRVLGQMGDLVNRLPGFPIEVSMEMVRHGQKVITSHRVRTIETRTAEPGLFEIPPGYERIEDSTLTLH